ncbi:MAG: type I polyketide synthase, partial [Solirubrobacterales bacterium]|nr:type I polyketide synthase [Solirubrobacterales bacterium]
LALAPEAAREFLFELGSEAELAAFNATHSVTISGPDAEIERLEAEAKRRGLWFRRLDLDFAFHSRAMDTIRQDLLLDLAGLSSRRPETKLMSTVTGEPVSDDRLDTDHWWRNIRSPVRFADAAVQAISEGFRIFIEIGPTAILQSYLSDALRTAQTDGRVLTSLSRQPVDEDPFPAIAAHCYVAGYDFTRSSYFDGPADPRGLPLYPWDRRRFWFGMTAEAADLVNPSFDHPLLGFRQHSPVPCWLNYLDEQVLPWIGDHAIEGMPVLPAAAIVEMALAAAQWQWPDAAVLEVRDLEVRRPLPFDKGRMRELRTVIGSEEGDWELASRPRLSREPLTIHAVGRIGCESDTRRITDWSNDTPNRRQMDRETLYRLASLAGLEYGSRFRTVTRIEVANAQTAVAHLDPAHIGEESVSYLLHPAMLDGALQALLGLAADCQPETQPASFLPWRFGRVRLLAPFGRAPRLARLHLTRIGIRSVSADVGLCDEAGEVVAELSDCWFRRVELTRRASVEERALRIDLVPAPLADSSASPVLHRCGATLSRLAASRELDVARREQALLLDALIGSIAFRSMLCFFDPGRSFAIAELVESGLVAPASSGLAECLLRVLERFGAASEAASEWRLENGADLPEVEEVWRLVLAEAPDLVAELALTASAFEDLSGTLRDGPRRPDASRSPMIEHLLAASPTSATGVGLICKTLH